MYICVCVCVCVCVMKIVPMCALNVCIRIIIDDITAIIISGTCCNITKFVGVKK